jgi:hypothetical protein
LVEARAVLYEWLIAKFPERVQIEHRPKGGSTLPRPIDVLVSLRDGRRWAFWIFDSAIKRRETRDSIVGYFSGARSTSVTWIFSSTMLKARDCEPTAVQLSKMEREFVVRTRYDQGATPGEGSLHYLDAYARQLTTFRRLERIHPPNIYEGAPCTTELNRLQVQPRSFDIVHPGEHERLKAFLESQEAQRASQGHAVISPTTPVTVQPALDQDGVAREHTTGRIRDGGLPVHDHFIVRCRSCGVTKSRAELVEWVRSKGEGLCRSCQRSTR